MNKCKQYLVKRLEKVAGPAEAELQRGDNTLCRCRCAVFSGWGRSASGMAPLRRSANSSPRPSLECEEPDGVREPGIYRVRVRDVRDW